MSEVEPARLPNMVDKLTPGARIFAILHKDALRERIDVRPSEVLGLEGDVLFLRQTEPPVGREHLGASIEAALLLDQEGALRPVGYAARLLNILDDYTAPDLTQVQALAISAPKAEDFFETSLRMHYRVTVDDDMGVLIRLEGLEGLEEQDSLDAPSGPELLDFSAGGARVRLPAGVRVNVGDQLPFKLVFLGSGYADGIGIVRSVEPTPDNRHLDLGLFFTNMEIRDIRYLERMVARTVSSCRQREGDAEYI